jgi:hypothetical protein
MYRDSGQMASGFPHILFLFLYREPDFFWVVFMKNPLNQILQIFKKRHTVSFQVLTKCIGLVNM